LYRKPVLTGRRIVDICHIFKQIQKIVHDDRVGCSFGNMEFISESRNGFFSKFKFVCQMCKTTAIISSDCKEESRLPINEAVTNGTVAIGKVNMIYTFYFPVYLHDNLSK